MLPKVFNKSACMSLSQRWCDGASASSSTEWSVELIQVHAETGELGWFLIAGILLYVNAVRT